jgi:hypothetical protein
MNDKTKDGDLKKKPANGQGGPPPSKDQKKEGAKPASESSDGDGNRDDTTSGAEGEGDGGDDAASRVDSESGSGEEDFRARMAGGDEATKKFLDRFTDEAALGRHLMALEKKVREKGGIKPPAADASLEDKAKFYTEHFGRPETPEKLAEIDLAPKIEEGETLSEDEAVTMSGVTAMMHKAGVFGEEQMRAANQIFADLVIGGRKEQDKAAQSFQDKARDELKKAWGRDYEANEALAVGYLQMRCQEAGVDRNELANIKLANGARLGDHPLFMKVAALGGRDHAEDPLMVRESGSGGARASEIQEQLNAEMAKSKGTPAERRYYDSPEGKAKRAKLRGDLKRMNAFGGGAARGGRK